MKRLIAYALIVVGLAILAYPKASEWYNDRQQEKLLAQWEEQLFDEDAAEEAREQYDGLTALFEQAEEDEIVAAETTEGDSDTEQPSATPAPVKLNAIASIRIPSINLKLPVLEGATQQNLKYAAAHLKETAPLGEIGNAAIAAHRMKARGKLFNRLNEVKEGDEVVIETKNEKFTYVVTGVSLVEPTDVSVLSYNQSERRLTLITCDPIVDPTHRLIVHAVMK